ncbi:uncharacterized protein LOC127860350 isoform X2 [Dreissena polymorpha]|nr:uncharacterized protein LOC127860350 isoform X2 [Dreissena polymorpha]
MKKETIHKAPLEEWYDVAADLVGLEPCDYSANLAKVFSMISYFEDFPDDSCADNYLDYRAIYRFLAQCMREENYEDVETLGSLESSVVVDLMHSLMEVLSTRDTFVQSHVMQWKYQLMDHRDEARIVDPRLLRMAADNDFEAFVEEVFNNLKENPDADTEIECTSDQLSKRKSAAENADVATTPSSNRKAANPAEVLVSTSSEQSICSETASGTCSTSRFTADVTGASVNQPSKETAYPAVSPSGSQQPGKATGNPAGYLSGSQKAAAASSPLTQAYVGSCAPILDYKRGLGRPRKHELPTNVKEENVIIVPFPPTVNSSVSNLKRTPEKSQVTASPVVKITPVSHQVPMDHPESELFTRKMVSLLPFSIKPKLGEPPARLKPGKKGKFDQEITPRTEIVVVMPPQGATIVQAVVRSRGKFAEHEHMIEDDVNREYYCNILRSDCPENTDRSQLQQKAISPAQSKAAKALAKKKILLARKRKFEAIVKAAKERSAPCKKPKVYSLNPFCLPVSLIDLDQ